MDMKRLKEILETELIKTDKIEITLYSILILIGVLIATRFVIFLVRKVVDRYSRKYNLDEGKKFAIFQVIKYLLWVMGITIALDSIGVKITVILAGSTALFVGIGLGLQSLFQNLAAGFIILSERTVAVGDIIEVSGMVGKVKKIGLRTTEIITRDDIVVIVPNNEFVSGEVVNWSQNQRMSRFKVTVGVAYGSDTQKVKELLLECAKEHKSVLNTPEPVVFFENFGDSSLDFSLAFYSNVLFRIERVKSDLRFEIDRKFRESEVVIPFPQQDIYIKEMPKK